MDNEYHQILPKISGYLEKKGRKKMMSCYKKYWFVLEGRLLLYYKSKDEYDAISPCKGSINLGPTSNIKLCNSNTGAFQIQSKTTTITLRAESLEEQNKWMEALISALKQRNDFRKLNHFRHSLGELSPTFKKIVLERQNTLPERLGPYSTEANISIIDKLQKIGGKSYGIGSKTNLNRQKPMSFSDESIPRHSNFKVDLRFERTESVIVENEEYGKLDPIRRTNSIESIDASWDGIYERIPSSDSVFGRGREDPQIIVNNFGYIHYERSKSAEGGIYSNPKEIFDRGSQINRTSFMTENDVYWNKCDVQNVIAIDYNENAIRQQLQDKEEENIYAEAEINGNINARESVEYADIEQAEYADAGEYVEIDTARNSSMSSQGSSEDKKFFSFGKKNKNLKDKPQEKKRKIRKSESFLQRVWHKKSKNKKNKKEISVSTSNIVERVEMSDDATLKTLSELQELLAKQSSVIMQLRETKHIKQTSIEEGEREINEMVHNNDNIEQNQAKDIKKTCPSLPPRNQKQVSTPTYQEPPELQPPSVPPKMKTKMRTTVLDNILNDLKRQSQDLGEYSPGSQNDDEIAEREIKKDENKEGKVKELIKRFSIEKEEGVELRQKNNNWTLKAANSNDLDILLEELAKVTTAPIMTPGVTTSLINPEISDKEILKLVPIRRRRMSDPDYDVPRPHRSLTNLPKKDDNALEATRFFGPILKPSDYESHASNRPPTPPADYHSNLPSITPDSLEIESRKINLSHDELRKMSFESHNYLSYCKTSHHNLNFLMDKNVYTDPRLLFRSKNDFSICAEGGSFHDSVESDYRFIDSLEPSF